MQVRTPGALSAPATIAPTDVSRFEKLGGYLWARQLAMHQAIDSSDAQVAAKAGMATAIVLLQIVGEFEHRAPDALPTG
jgi:hypothetical protein